MVRSLRSWSLPLLLVVPCATAACGDNGADPDAGDPAADATAGPDAIVLDASPDAMATLPLAGFGDLTGMCDLLDEPDLIGTAPELFSVDLSFPRRYVDPDDRPLLTPGGLEAWLVNAPSVTLSTLLFPTSTVIVTSPPVSSTFVGVKLVVSTMVGSSSVMPTMWLLEAKPLSAPSSSRPRTVTVLSNDWPALPLTWPTKLH